MSRCLLRARKIALGHSRGTIDDGVVEVVDGRISAVGPASGFGSAALDEGLVHDFGDATILPGLIDAHAHLSFPADGSSYDEISKSSEDKLYATVLHNAERHAAGGVTSIRDNGAPGSSIFRARRKLMSSPAPRILLAGRPVTRTDGHMHWCGGGANGPVDIRAQVRRLVAEGADHIKLVASGGGTVGTWPWVASYTREELEAAVDEAHTAGLLTTAHCHATDAIANAVRAGVDCIEHATFLGEPRADAAPHQVIGVAVAGYVAQYDARIVEEMVDRGTYVGFTFAGGYGTVLALEAKQREGILTTAEADVLMVSREHVRRKIELCQRFVRDGLSDRIVVSSDAGPGDNQFGQMWLNLALAVQAGMTPLAAIEAATSRAAAAVGISAHTGSLQTGLAADVLVVAGDATEDVTRTSSVRLVIKDGKVLYRGEDQALKT